MTSEKLRKQGITTLHIVFICNSLTDSIRLRAIWSAFFKKGQQKTPFINKEVWLETGKGRAANGFSAYLNVVFYGFEV